MRLPLSPRRDVVWALPTLARACMGVAMLGFLGVTSCTPMRPAVEAEENGAGNAAAPDDDVVAGPQKRRPVASTAEVVESVETSELDPVLARFGWRGVTSASLEFVFDHGDRGAAFRLPDGRALPLGTTWTFSDPAPVLAALADAHTTAFVDDRWPGRSIAFQLRGTMADGRTLQISFGRRSGRATLSRFTVGEALEGGDWAYRGADDALFELMRTTVPELIEVPLRRVAVWRVPAARAPDADTLVVARSESDLVAQLAGLDPPPEADRPDGFSFSSGLTILVRAPAETRPSALSWGSPVLRDGEILEQLVFHRLAPGAPAETASVMLLFVDVTDPAALKTVVLAPHGRPRIERRLD